MSETFYEVVLNGSYNGRDNKNILYYRTGSDVMGGAFGFGGAEDLAQNIIQEVVPAHLGMKPAEYLLQSIDVHVKNASFAPVYQMPVRVGVNLYGTGNWGLNNTDGPGICCNFRFDLEPKLLGEGTFSAPNRGYLAVGPIPSDWIDNRGVIITSGFSDGVNHAMEDLKAALVQNLEQVLPPAVWFPVRVRKHWGLLGVGSVLLGWGFSDISGGSWDYNTSYRRSRRNVA